MVKLGILTDEISQDFEHALKITKALGARYVELRSMWGDNIINLPTAELNKARDLVERYELKVCGIASPLFKCPLKEKGKKKTAEEEYSAKEQHLRALAQSMNVDKLQEEGYSGQLRVLQRAIELARMFNTNIIRTFSFWKEGDLSDEVLKEIVQKFQVPIAAAQREGIILGLENEHECNLGSGASCRRFFDRISSKNVGLIWDAGNAYRTGERPYPDGYEQVKDRIVHVHLKDAGRDEKGEPIWLPIGKGEIDYAGQIKALSADGYSGVLCLETHYVTADGSMERGTRESFAGMQTILRSMGIAIE